VVVTLISSPSAQVSVLGNVANPALLAIEPTGSRILDLIARAGGVLGKGEDAIVTLLRGGQSRSFKLATLLTNAGDNAFVKPGDTIYVKIDSRSYVVLGALTQNGTYRFDGERINLVQALGRAGGLVDIRANPGYVYIYREVDRPTLRRLGGDDTQFGETRIPVVFHANLDDPSNMFAANKFQVHSGDVIYVSNAEGYEVAKVVQLLYMISDTASKAVYAGNGIGTN
jgi:polysaccharide export outer membrane protein